MTEPVLIASDLYKSYSSSSGAATNVLRGVSLKVHEGEFIAIVGASGAGKSTLLHLLGGLEAPDAGTIRMRRLDNHWVSFNTVSDEMLSGMRNAQIGFVFQFHHLLPEFTALENVMMPALISGTSKNVAVRHAAELLEQVGLQEKLNEKPSTLSGGEQQRVAFARALTNAPSLILADEPTGNLDAENSALLLDLMMRHRQQNHQTFVVVTHSTHFAQYADRVLILNAGRIEEREKPN